MESTGVTGLKTILWKYFNAHKRTMPWREPEADGTFDPYKILVSEIMLQQTQVARVIPKYEQFIAQFPDVRTLAASSLGEVLTIWNGLGYNRRAKYVWQTAQKIVSDFGGEFPSDQEALESLPGVGANTAGAIRAYAFGEPAVFIETNIRTVFIHHFFKDELSVPDSAVRKVLGQMLTGQPPREFYWALMDYGAYLKSTVGNVSHASRAYVKQPAFKGSRRHIRGQVIRLLTVNSLTEAALADRIADERLGPVLSDLEREGFIERTGTLYKLI